MERDLIAFPVPDSMTARCPLARPGMRSYQKLVPLCRHHHKCKQAEGWRLAQPEPGVLVWHTPAGRSYVTTPTVYPA
jgi:hypothetical protein